MKTRTYILVWSIVAMLFTMNLQSFGQQSTNTVDYQVTYNNVTGVYSVWVVPNYNTPNTNNILSTESGATAQVTLKVPTAFNISNITNVIGTWSSTPLKLGPAEQPTFFGNTTPALPVGKSYYVIGKGSDETNYGQFTTGVPIKLFTFTGNSCVGGIEILSSNDVFVSVADNVLSLNTAPSFYSRSGQPAGGNQNPLEQYRAPFGAAANCLAAVNDSYTAQAAVPANQAVLQNDLFNGVTPATASQVAVTINTNPTNGTVSVNPNGSITYTANVGFSGIDTYVYRICDLTSPAVCSTATVTVTVTCPPPVVPTASVSTQPTCLVTTGTITVTAPANGAGITYTLVGTSPVVAAITNATGVFSGRMPGNYNVTTTNANGCTSSPTANLIINSVPSPPVLSGATAVCIGSTANVSPNSGGTWTSSNTAIATITNAGVVTGVTAGTVTLTYTVTSNGCSSSTSFTVTPNNTAATVATTTLCIGTAISRTQGTTGATGIGVATGLPAGVTVTWAANTITFSGSPTAAGTFNYSIPLTGGCGAVNATGTITVTPNNTAATVATTTLCIGTAISRTQGTTGATGIGVATGLPAGVTATWVANTITFSGSPTASGTFNYSIPLTGGCGTVNATGTIEVTPNNTAATVATTTLCIGTVISRTQGTTGATGIGTPTGLPAGVTVTWAANTITFSGSPTASGTFNYSIPLTGGCGTVNATGTIEVTPNNTAATVATTTLCIGIAISRTQGTTGATGIGTPTGLPAGVTVTWAANTITFNGSPTASGTFNYSIPLTGGCGTVNATGTITVTPNNTAATVATTTLCIGTAITRTQATTGATGIGTPTGLPAGVTITWAANTITFSGSPTASGTFNYSIPLTGGCGTVNATGTIEVTPNNTAATVATTTLCIGTVISRTQGTTGATGIGVATGLPAGVTVTWAANTITFSGSPTASGTFNYSIPLTGGCGTVNATGTIEVTPNNTAATVATTTLCIGTAISRIQGTTGATGIGTPTGLPAGVTVTWAANTITFSGSPTASGTFTYIIPLTGGCGTVNATGTIEVTPNNTAATVATTTLCIGTAISRTQGTTGATGIGTPTGLPAGVTVTWAANTITFSGSPTASGTFNYSIPLTGGCGTVNATGTIEVTPNNTAATVATTTLCIGTAISRTQGTTGATGIGVATGLPAGVTATWVANTITFSGSPTASGTFNYSIPLTGGCGTVNATGTIEVTPNNTAATVATTTLCIGTAISRTQATTGATGIGTPTGLPAGVTATWAANTITFSGSPTASGTFTYSIPLTGGCGAVNATGTIEVTPNNTAATVATTTLCIGTAISRTQATTGATGIGTPTGLPAGVTVTWAANTITFSGSPTASGTFNYSIPLTGGCGTVNATGTIEVTPNNTAATVATTTLCIGTAISRTQATTGATGIGTPTGLPAGVTVTWAANTISFSGSPTASGTFTYSIPLTGGCGTVNATGTITVTPNNTAATVATTTLCIGTAISRTQGTTGATGIGVATGLPAGVTVTWAANTITFSGSPTASGTFTYSIPLTGGCGTVNATGTITVTPNNTAATVATTTLCIGTAISRTQGTTGATGIGVATGLPAGVTVTWAANTITFSGSPTASGTFTYIIPLTGGCGTVNATGTIEVTPNNTAATVATTTLCIGTAISRTQATTGATGIGTPTGLPAGVTATWAANTITFSGSPTASGTFTYSIPLTGSCGTVNATGTIEVTPNNTAATVATTTLCIGTAISRTQGTTGATGIGVATGLPAGVTVTWAANTITFSGSPTASGTFNYSIPLTGGCGTVNATGTIEVTPNNTAATVATTTLCIGTAISRTQGTTGATGIGVATGLPAGVTVTWAANTITFSGSPTASGTFNYSIPLTGGCGTVNATGTITVTPNNTAATVATTTLCIGTAISRTQATTGATGIGVATGLPAGVTATWAANTITFSGSPTASGTFTYSIPLTGGCGTVNATGTIEVTPNNTAATVATTTLCIGTAISRTQGTTGATGIGTATGLPAGVTATWAANTITFSGSPTASGTFTYIIPLTGGCGTVNATGTIEVTPNNTAATVATTTLCIGTAISRTQATTGATGIGTPTGLPAGVTATWAANTITFSGSPTASGTFTYSIPLTGGCGAVNATGTIEVTPNNTAATVATTTLCIGTAISRTQATTGATGIGTPTGLPAGVTATWAANTITFSGSPTASGTFTYSIPLTGGCGTVNAIGTIVVTPNNAAATIATTTLCIGTVISRTQATTGATGIGTPTGLPAGVTATWAANTITFSGSPTASGTFTYSIPLTGGCGAVNATGTIEVTPNNTAATVATTTLCIGTAISRTQATTGATGIGTPTGLPAGVTATWAANTITFSGSPTASGTFTYSIPLTGGCGTVNAIGTIVVTPNNAAATIATTTLCIGTVISRTQATTGATGIGTPTGLPAGVTATWAANTITFSGSPTASGTFTYSIPLTGGCGTVNATGTIEVTPNNTAATVATTTLCIGTAISRTQATTGATGIGTPSGLPAGVTVTWAANTITFSGSPTVSGTFTYSIPLTGGCGTVNATGTIVVNGISNAGTIAASQTICSGTAPVAFTSTTAAAGTGTITYQWQRSTDGGTSWSDIVTATNAIYTSGVLTVTTQFRRLASAGGCTPATAGNVVIVTIIPCQPIAVNDVAVTPVNRPVTANVLVNDSDPQNSPLVVTTTPISNPTNGTVTLASNGNYTYTPATNFVGEDTFCYEITNGIGLKSTACVVIDVLPSLVTSNNPPVAVDDNTETIMGTAVTVVILANDADPDNPSTPNGTLGTPLKLTDPTNGTVTFNVNGTITYTPSPNFTGIDSFNYRICDNGTPSLCDEATVRIIVKATPSIGNQPPIAMDDAEVTIANTPVSNTVVNNDRDPDNTLAQLTFTKLTDPTNGTVTFSSNGSYTYTPNNGFIGNDSYTYRVCDPSNACDVATVSIAVLNPTQVALLPKVWLQGALFGVTGASGIMRDDLRSKNLIPLTSPYPAMGMTEITPSSAITSAVLGVASPVQNSIVDWVFVELRDAANPATVLNSTSALIQRDGDIVGLDGVSPVIFNQANFGNYYVAVRHRNHLGVMSASPIAMSLVPATVDFRNGSTPAYNLDASNILNVSLVVVNQGLALWAGNSIADTRVILQGNSNDVNVLFESVIGHPGNLFGNPFYKIRAYNIGDINMNGETVFQGSGNDVEFIYLNVIQNHPGNILKQNFFIIKQQLP